MTFANAHVLEYEVQSNPTVLPEDPCWSCCVGLLLSQYVPSKLAQHSDENNQELLCCSNIGLLRRVKIAIQNSKGLLSSRCEGPCHDLIGTLTMPILPRTSLYKAEYTFKIISCQADP